MDSDSIPTIFLLTVLIAMSGYFSSAETAFTSANRIRLRTEAKKGDRKSERALQLAEDYTNLLSTILVGNNIVNIASSTIATILFVSLFPTYGATLSTVIMTIIVLIFGEITPKAMAKQSPEKIAKLFAPTLLFLMKVLRPLNWFFAKWNTFLSARLHSEDESGITEDELLSLVDEAESEGNIQVHEHELIRSAIEFSDIEVTSILTPRVDVVAIDWRAEDREIQCLFDTHEYSRVVLYEDTIDHVLGILHEKDFNRYLRQKMAGKLPLSLQDVRKEALFVPPMTRISRLLRTMQQKKIHMAIVSDEYGGTLGIVTLEDILEELVGEIWDESDEIEEDTLQLQEGWYMLRGHVSLEKVFQLFHLEGPERYVSNTINGLLTEWLGRFPQEGDLLTVEGLEVQVMKVTDFRVEEVRMRKIVLETPSSTS